MVFSSWKLAGKKAVEKVSVTGNIRKQEDQNAEESELKVYLPDIF
jgi:hypothetical protein